MSNYAPIMEMVIVTKIGDEKRSKGKEYVEMDKKELWKRYEKQDGMGKALLLEKLTFCRFADRYDFENYFRIGELKDSDLLCLASFLYHHECFLMLFDMMNQYKERFIFADTSLLREFEPDDALMERLSKIDALEDV